MHSGATLTAEEFKVLHNSLCDLDRFSQFKEIADIVERIRTVALKSAYAQENESFDRKWKNYDKVRTEAGLRSIWSLYDVPDLSAEHPYPADLFVVYDRHWGGHGVHCAVYGRTWADIYKAADHCIQNSGDDHHVFIEGFELKNGNELHMHTGS